MDNNSIIEYAEDRIYHQASWLKGIPPEVRKYVMMTLKDTFGYHMADLSPTETNVCIYGALTWVPLTGWWIYHYTSCFASQEEYEFVHRYRFKPTITMEMDPSQLMSFRRHPIKSTFEVRTSECIGLTKLEEGQILGFVNNHLCPQLDIDKLDPQFIRDVVWATLMWILDEDYSAEWIAEFDVIYSSAYDMSIAYLGRTGSNTDIFWNEVAEYLPLGKSLDQMTADEINYFSSEVVKPFLSKYAHQIETESLHPLEALSQFLFQEAETLENLHKECAKEQEEAIEAEYEFVTSLYEEIEHQVISAELIKWLEEWETSTSLYNPLQMMKDKRKPGSCAGCGEDLWCISRTPFQTDGGGKQWMALCAGCSEKLRFNKGSTRCKNNCRNTKCDYANFQVDEFGNRILQNHIEIGKRRLEAFQNYLAEQPLGTMGGITMQDINEHFEIEYTLEG